MTKQWTDRLVSVNGIRSHYLDSGNGEPIVLLHGGLMWECAEVNYGPVIPYLRKDFRVVAVDNVGSGLTHGEGKEHYSAAARAEFLISFLDALKLKDVHLAGNSFGGWIVQYVAHERPDLVKSLIVINSLAATGRVRPGKAGRPYVYTKEAYRRPTRESMLTTLKDFYIDQSIVTDDKVDLALEIARANYEFVVARDIATRATRRVANENMAYRGKIISEFAKDLRVPVLMTWSRENPGSTVEDACRFLQDLRRGELHAFVNAGHHVMVEKPEEWSRVVTGFLQSLM